MKARGPRGGALPYLVLAIALVASGLAAWGFRATVNDRDHARFRVAVNAIQDRVDDRLETYVAVLLATRGMFVATDQRVDVEQFRRFVAQLELQRHYPGIQGIGFTRRFHPDQRDALEAELRAQGQTDFRTWPVDGRDEHHAIVFLEPMDRRNRAALGYDMYSEPTRREAMARARDTGLPAATGLVTLVQEIDRDKQAGFLIYLPVYRTSEIPPTFEARGAALVGFVYSPFRMADLLAGVFGSRRDKRVSFDIQDAATGALLHQSNDPREPSRFETTQELEVAGRTWLVHYRSRPALAAGSSAWMFPYVIVLGLAISGLLFMLSRTQAHAQAARSEALAREQSLRREAETASQTKDEFLAILGHELRNPLAPIVTALELLEHRAGSSPPREYGVIERQVRHLRRLVDDLLDVSATTRGKVALARQRLELATAVHIATELVEPMLEEKHHTLEVDVPPEGLVVSADEARLVQIISNLLSNAAKYTDPGGHIRVTAAAEGDDVILRVSDNGIGVAPEALPHLFDLFVQADRRVDRARGGLGIGLTLVKSLVELHGGRVEGRSEGVGKGSEFVVRLPRAPQLDAKGMPAERAPRAKVPRTRAPRRVLVVDDNPDAADLIAEYLRDAGHDPVVAYDPVRALELAAQQPPDIAILDIGLPVMDGYELATRLPGTQPVLIAVTGYGQDHDRARSKAAGFAHHLIKPVAPLDLIQLVDEPLPPSRQSSPTEDESRTP
jgi:signal transduction histidine kinase/CheY-like chemotaxis protein